MTATNTRLPPGDRLRVRHWFAGDRLGAGGLVLSGLFALAPKCFLCLAAYISAGAALRFGGPEICGATASSAPWLTWWPVLVVATGLAGYRWFGRRRREPAAIVRPS